MTNRIARISTFALGALLVVGASSKPLSAQALDARWQAWSGCWAPVGTLSAANSNAIVCVVPAQGTSAVEVVTIVAGKVDDRMRIEADGVPHPVSRDGCTGMESATWASTGTRLYLTSDLTCTGGIKRTGKSVMSFNQRYEWLEVRGMQSSDVSGVAVSLYAALSDTTTLPAEIARLVTVRGATANNATLAASSPLSLADIADVAIRTDSGVATTWIVERTSDLRLSITGKQLTALADQGVPPSIIDVLVALAHPTVFALDSRSREASMKAQPQGSSVSNAYGYRGGYGSSYCSGWMSSRMSYYGMYSPFYYGSSAYDPCYSGYSAFRYGGYYGYGTGYGYGYGGGYGYYPQPIVVVNGGNNGTSVPRHGRVTKGQGYTEGRSSGGSGESSSSSSGKGGTGSSTSGSASSGAASGGGAASSGTSSSGGERTAVRKPPQ